MLTYSTACVVLMTNSDLPSIPIVLLFHLSNGPDHYFEHLSHYFNRCRNGGIPDLLYQFLWILNILIMSFNEGFI